MEIIDPGHKYRLDALDGEFEQVLTFVKRCDFSNPDRYPGNTNSYPGTTTQEVLRALIERTQYVQNQIPCIENECIIAMLRQCLYLLESRAKKRKGQLLSLPAFEIEAHPTCQNCGHIRCAGCHKTHYRVVSNE